MNNFFNSLPEVAMRILIILSISNEEKDIDTITVIDFIYTYSKYFNINYINLHGDNNFNYCGFASRRMHIQKSLSVLLEKHFIKTIDSKNGIEYSIMEKHKKICENLKSTYSKKYKEIVNTLLIKTKNKSSKKLIDVVNDHITNSIKETNYYD